MNMSAPIFRLLFGRRADLPVLLGRFDELYARADYERAAKVAGEAIDRFPVKAYRHFVTHRSGPWVTTLSLTGRLDSTVDQLDQMLARHPDMNVLCDDSFGAAERMVKAREERIAAGLPSVAFIPQGKSGSVTLGTVFTNGFRLPCVAYSLVTRRVIPSWAKDYARGGAAYVTHLYPESVNISRLKESGISKVIVHVRDPRQALLSFVHHIDRYPMDFPQLNNDDYRRLTLNKKIDVVFDEWYPVTVDWIEGWAKAAGEMDILFSTFEEFRTSPQSVVERYLAYYGGDRSWFDSSTVFSHDEKTDYHFRRGEIDEWRRVFSPEQIERVNGALSEEVRLLFGWE